MSVEDQLTQILEIVKRMEARQIAARKEIVEEIKESAPLMPKLYQKESS